MEMPHWMWFIPLTGLENWILSMKCNRKLFSMLRLRRLGGKWITDEIHFKIKLRMIFIALYKLKKVYIEVLSTYFFLIYNISIQKYSFSRDRFMYK